MLAFLNSTSRVLSRKFFTLLMYVLTFFSGLFNPRNRHIWVFGSRFGQRYDENSKHLFEYVNRIAPEIRAIWLTKNYKIYRQLKKNGYEVYMAHSFHGCLYSLLAGVVIVSICLMDVNKPAVTGARVIQLWHGTPLKRTDIFSLGEKYDMVILAAEEYLHNHLIGDTSKARFVLTGYPKNDILFSPKKIQPIEQLKTKYCCEKFILYLPTYRDIPLSNGKTDPIDSFDLFIRFGFSLERIENLMKPNHALFILKLHPVQTITDRILLDRIQKSRYVHMVDPADPFQDVYEYLKYTDVLLTDYSSVYFDFLLLNRPIIFTPFDFDHYVSCRPLGYPYNQVTPGPKAKNWEELYAHLQAILAGEDDWNDLRGAVNKRFNAYRDGHSSQRVFREIKTLIGIDHYV